MPAADPGFAPLAIRERSSKRIQVTYCYNSVLFFDFRAETGDGVARDVSILALHGICEVDTMRETIRFAWGISSLGDFVVAMSGTGVVALEFSSTRAAMEQALRIRFPKAELVPAQDELADALVVVAGVIDDPATDCDLPLDLRGTPYEIDVWHMLREIPAGQTTSYGALAAKLGSRDPRDVTAAIASNPVAVIVPCHRVIKKDGSISGYRWGVRRKRVLLAREQKATEH